MTPRQQLAAIDRRIDAIHAELCRLETIDQFSASSWQEAWDKHPDLRAEERALYLSRYDAQQARDEEMAGLRRKLDRVDFRAREIDLAIQDRVTEHLLCARRWSTIGERNIAHRQMMRQAHHDANL